MPIDNRDLGLTLSSGTNIGTFLAPILFPIVNVPEESGFLNYSPADNTLMTDTELDVANNTRGPSSEIPVTPIYYKTKDKIVAARLTWKERKGLSDAEIEDRLISNVTKKQNKVHTAWEKACYDNIYAYYTGLSHSSSYCLTNYAKLAKNTTSAALSDDMIQAADALYESLNGYTDGVSTIFGDYTGIEILVSSLRLLWGSDATFDKMLQESVVAPVMDIVLRGIRFIGSKTSYNNGSANKRLWNPGTNTKQLFYTKTQARPLEKDSYLSYGFTATCTALLPNAQQAEGLPWQVDSKLTPEMPQDDVYLQALSNYGINTISTSTVIPIEGTSGNTYDLW